MTHVFSETLAQWRDYTETPWARLRYEVVGEVLRRQARALGDGLRVLDVGGGDGMDALPLAKSGHHITDPSKAWLAEAQRRADAAKVEIATILGGLDDLPTGEWDLVLCHFVLRDRPAGAGDIEALASRVRRGGRLSIIDVNPAGRVLRTLINGGPAAAASELHSDRAEVETFQTDARKLGMDEARAESEAAVLTVVGIYGNRVANDLLTDNDAKHDAAYFEELLDLEMELCDREPFNRVGFAWQLILQR